MRIDPSRSRNRSCCENEGASLLVATPLLTPNGVSNLRRTRNLLRRKQYRLRESSRPDVEEGRRGTGAWNRRRKKKNFLAFTAHGPNEFQGIRETFEIPATREGRKRKRERERQAWNQIFLRLYFIRWRDKSLSAVLLRMQNEMTRDHGRIRTRELCRVRSKTPPKEPQLTGR